MLQIVLQYASAGAALGLPPMETMGDRIKNLRDSRNLTQRQLADRLNARGASVTDNAISQWERGGTEHIRPRNLLALIQEFGTTLEYLVHGPSDPSGRDSSGKFRRLRLADSDNKPGSR